MYENEMRWAGRLTQDPRILDPRQAGDAYLFSFCVAQNMPRRSKANGKTEERSQFLNVIYRASERNAARLKEKLVKAQFVIVTGELVIDHKDTPNGRVTYVTIDASKLQFPPVQYVNAKEPEAPAAEKPASVADAHPDVFNPARFCDDPA